MLTYNCGRHGISGSRDIFIKCTFLTCFSLCGEFGFILKDDVYFSVCFVKPLDKRPNGRYNVFVIAWSLYAILGGHYGKRHKGQNFR